MKTEWWYESAIYDMDRDVVLARLTLRDDGTAQVLTDGGEIRDFASWDEASYWLSDEEYYPLDSLYESLAEQGVAIDPRITPPLASCDGELVRQMVIKLG
jgi:hypothetical protein